MPSGFLILAGVGAQDQYLSFRDDDLSLDKDTQNL